MSETETQAPPRPAVAIVGAGTMGAGIAQVVLEADWAVRLVDAAPEAETRAEGRIREGLQRRARRVAPDDDPAAWAAIRLDRLTLAAGSLSDAVAGVELVIEAAVEDLAAKRQLFGALDAAAPEARILATNTSALRIRDIGAATRRPGRVLGLHFFNPAPLMALVEVVAGPGTDPAALDRAEAIVASWGKTPVRAADSAGFIVNRINRPYTLEPLRLLHAAAGTIESIDAALVDVGFPMGPFALMDLIGIDVNLAAARELFTAFDRVPRFRPSPIQERLVGEGRLGRKSGEGFYRYDANARTVGPASTFVGEGSGSLAPTDPALRLEPEAIAERVILAIVNEAYRALGEGVATATDIDRAMRLGANHPFGPFEWATTTGLSEVAAMLDALTDEDPDTFRPALPLLRAAAGIGP